MTARADRMERSFTLHSDGTSRDCAAGAAIVEDTNNRRLFRLGALLSRASSADAEAAGALLGLAFISWYSKAREEVTLVEWFTDSEDLLRRFRSGDMGSPTLSGLQAVRSCFRVAGKHTRAHLGRGRNDSCDRACRWIRERGASLLEVYGEGPVGLMARKRPEAAWHMLDLRSSVSLSDILSRLELLGPVWFPPPLA